MSRSVLSRLSTTYSLVMTFLVLSMTGAAQAADITWGGTYRLEGVKIQNPELRDRNTDKSYLLHHLVLNPKIVAADGLTIFGRLDVLNNPNFGIGPDGQVMSVAGDILGNGPGGTPLNSAAPAGPTGGADSNAYGSTQRAGFFSVTSLYLSWAQEFGQLVVGRAPLHFGLGTAFNSGNGLFDHFITTRDMLGYKLVLGNLSVMPIKAKFSQGALNSHSDVDEYMVHVQYDNPETELSLGFLYNKRIVTGNDTPASDPGPPAYTSPIAGYIGGVGATRAGSFDNSLMGFYFSQKAGDWLRATIEADIVSGDMGVKTAAGNAVSLNAWGLAAEFAWIPPAESRWGATLKLGLASGDDPGTLEKWEGYSFHRNYRVGTLMFSHPLGQPDLFRTGLVRDTTKASSSQIDTEAVSNTLYLAPVLQYHHRDNLSYGLTFVYARLNQDPLGAGFNTAKDLGFEVDFSINYKPMERVTWITELGTLFPGDAWKGGSNNFDTKMTYGIVTRAAISF